ncbi:FecR family protein [Chryseobacterium lactis]|nr:FecR family protein [Chryseobacterium lactis]
MEERRILEELKIVPLLTKFVRGEHMTVLEEKTIEIWLNKSSANRAFFEQLQDKEHVARELLKRDAAGATTSSELQKLHGLLKKRQSHYKRVIIWTSAAAILLFFSMTILLYRYSQYRNFMDEAIKVATADIDPGKEQATLSFENGKSVELKGKPIRTDSNGTFYSDGTSIAENTVQFATLSTPRKGQYKMTLPDGTKVFLNAESSLKFPTQFTENRREVELTGEGYFEVTHDIKKPFIVTTRGQKLKVLGTKFNVSSYENETAILTTLISGSVELTNSQNNTPVILKPGQQGKLLSLSSIFLVDNVDTEVFTAWTSNDFHFDGTPLKEVFKQLERWYDVDVDYKKVPNVRVHGTISREKKLSTVLYTLQQITDLQFKLTGRRIEVDNN